MLNISYLTNSGRTNRPKGFVRPLLLARSGAARWNANGYAISRKPTQVKRLMTNSGLVMEALPAGLPPVT